MSYIGIIFNMVNYMGNLRKTGIGQLQQYAQNVSYQACCELNPIGQRDVNSKC